MGVYEVCKSFVPLKLNHYVGIRTEIEDLHCLFSWLHELLDQNLFWLDYWTYDHEDFHVDLYFINGSFQEEDMWTQYSHFFNQVDK